MRIKQDPVTKLWCRSDGAILMPPTGGHFKTFRWTFGAKSGKGYRQIQFRGEFYRVHQMVCRAFNGLAPEGKPFVDHINRIRDDNRPENLHWVDRKENNDNHGNVLNRVDYGVRACDDLKAYRKAYNAVHREESRVWHKAYRAKKKAKEIY